MGPLVRATCLNDLITVEVTVSVSDGSEAVSLSMAKTGSWARHVDLQRVEDHLRLWLTQRDGVPPLTRANVEDEVRQLISRAITAARTNSLG